jgi:hypothetical protein
MEPPSPDPPEGKSMDSSTPSWLLPAASARRAAQAEKRSRWWPRAFASLRSPLGFGIGAALGGLALLLAFQKTVAGGVERAQEQRKAALAQGNGAWRCNLLADQQDRALCQTQVMAGSQVR